MSSIQVFVKLDQQLFSIKKENSAVSKERIELCVWVCIGVMFLHVHSNLARRPRLSCFGHVGALSLSQSVWPNKNSLLTLLWQDTVVWIYAACFRTV